MCLDPWHRLCSFIVVLLIGNSKEPFCVFIRYVKVKHRSSDRKYEYIIFKSWLNKVGHRRNISIGVPLDLSTRKWSEVTKCNGVQVSQLI